MATIAGPKTGHKTGFRKSLTNILDSCFGVNERHGAYSDTALTEGDPKTPTNSKSWQTTCCGLWEAPAAAPSSALGAGDLNLPSTTIAIRLARACVYDRILATDQIG